MVTKKREALSFMVGLHQARSALASRSRPLSSDGRDTNKALRHKLLAVPSLRDRYLAYIGDIAEKWLDWNRLGPIVEAYRNLIADDIARDTRKHGGAEDFLLGIMGAPDSTAAPTTVKGFTELRRAALLAHPEIMRVRRP